MKKANHFRSHWFFYLILILIVAVVLRARFITLCDPDDRAQVALGMTNNLPPLYHYISVPFYYFADNVWYAPAIANIFMDVIIIVILFYLGLHINGTKLGLLFSSMYSLYPEAILNAKKISPETTETFAVMLIIFLFIKYEFSKNNSIFWSRFLLISFFFAVMFGAFAKQQTLVVIAPILLYLVYKYRMQIVKQDIFYALIFAPIPYFAFLLSHPEMLGAVVIYFSQSSVQVSVGEKAFRILYSFCTRLLPYLCLTIVSLFVVIIFGMKKRIKKENDDFPFVSKDLLLFLCIYTVVIMSFIMNTLSYTHLLIFPVLFFSGILLLKLGKLGKTITSLALFAVIILLISYALFGFFLSIPQVSINTNLLCEQSSPETYPLLLSVFGQSGYNTPIFNPNNHFEQFFKDEKYIVVGGNTGQDLKYNIYHRLYYPSVINTERFNEINYAFLVYPLDKTYQDVPAWDYEYTKYLLENSVVVYNGTWATGNDFVILKIINHNSLKPELNNWKERSRVSLKLQD